MSNYPKIGIRPTIDGRQGGVRESLEDLVYQIGIEDGAVFAVVLRIVETFLEVEILLAMELLIIGSVRESLLYESQDAVGSLSFAELLHMVAQAVPDMRVRFTTSNPEDMTEDILHAIAEEPNLCKHIHFPAQSGSNKIL